MIHIIIVLLIIVATMVTGIIKDKTNWISDKLFLPIIWGLWALAVVNWMVVMTIR